MFPVPGAIVNRFWLTLAPITPLKLNPLLVVFMSKFIPSSFTPKSNPYPAELVPVANLSVWLPSTICTFAVGVFVPIPISLLTLSITKFSYQAVPVYPQIANFPTPCCKVEYDAGPPPCKYKNGPDWIVLFPVPIIFTPIPL